MKICGIIDEQGLDCKNYVEGNTDYCATHNHKFRKSARTATKPPKKRKAIPRVSRKRKEENKEYAELRKQFLYEKDMCEAMLLPDCTVRATEVHHAAKRGDNFLNVSTWLAVCGSCHSRIETKLSAKERRDRGLLITFNSTEPHKI